jgi:hypothetical protein
VEKKLGNKNDRRKVSDVKASRRLPICKSRSLPDHLLTSSGMKAFNAASASVIIARRSANGICPSRPGGAKVPVFKASSAHTEWCATHSIWKWNAAISGKRRRPTKSSGSVPVSVQWAAARSRKPPTALTVCRKVGTLRS